MVIDLIFILALLVCAIMLTSGKSLNINVTHLHKIEEKEEPKPIPEPDAKVDDAAKELTEFLQEFWGVTHEE